MLAILGLLVIKNVLERSPITRELVEDGNLTIFGAKYSLETGEVAVLTRVDASNLAEMAVEEETVSAGESE